METTQDIETRCMVYFQISKILTENQETKTKNIKLRQNLEEAVDKLEIIFGEKIDLENFTETLQVHQSSISMFYFVYISTICACVPVYFLYSMAKINFIFNDMPLANCV